ncbi:serpin B13 isoform X2 [Otolemur garnettii]|uniref:serpin B13 isoform X2 n=1 Tax=Otolemur garnettii TaxID=30611 RepID=UPI000C7F4520|nr:serpin B13 isoform X2 [Otolemur garnettii]
MDSFSTASTYLGFDLLNKPRKRTDGNILFSPVGISTTIGMILMGSRGITASQLQEVFCSEEDTESSGIKAEEEVRRLHTKDLFPDGSLSSLTKLVLMNTIYFKGQWDRKFKKENTKEEAFWLNKSTSRSVLMMTLKHSFSFTFLEDLQAKIVGIPYKNNDLSLFVLLPNDIDGLEEIIDKISPEQLVEWTSPGHMEKRSVHLHVPRLEVEDSYFLEDVLADMAMGNNFGECQANCLEMSPRSSLQAQKILHRCCIALTEEGTEAAAATGIDFNDASAPGDENPRDENVCCDHPFLFFIRHNESKNVLFFGRFSSP